MPAGRLLIPRDALFARLSAADAGGVVLVCAPAGSGKTVLLRSWALAEPAHGRVAWVQVEQGERDGQRFLLSVVNALADVSPVVRRVDPAPSLRGEAIVDQLLDDLVSLEEPAVLVIDDLHELRSAEAARWLEMFLADLPSSLRVALATREDPRLGLHRLRLAGVLSELRVPDLRFSLDETSDLLRAAGITLSEAAVARLHERTEGWAAGLRLAAISLGQHDDPERFVTEFSGSERGVAGYLMAEVLEHQLAEVREMLLRTSVLERVSGPLADYLTGGAGSERILQELEDANAFVTSLDAARTWFRYHQLFAELLQLELRRAAPAMMRALHRAAAEWHEREGYVVEAIRHAQAARDWPMASRLLADNHLDLILAGRTGTLSDLLSAFPADVVAGEAELALVFAAASIPEQELEQSAAHAELALRLNDTLSPERRSQFDVLLQMVTLVLARWRGDLHAVLEARQAMEATLAARPAGARALDQDFRAVALENLGVAELWSARFDDARSHLEQARVVAQRAGRPWLEVANLGHLGIVGPWTGMPLSAGLELSELAVSTADAHGWGEDPVIVTALAAGAMNLLSLGRFEEAEGWLERAERTLHPEGEPGTELIVHHARGLLSLAQGRLDQALVAFQATERMQALLATKHAFAVAGRARLLQTQVRIGELAAARAALADISQEDRDTSHMRLAAAAIHLAEQEPEPALDVLGPVVESSVPAIHRPSAVIEACAVEALAHDQLGDRRATEASLEQALEQAEPEGIVLPFVLAPVQELLERIPRHRTAHATLVRTILDVLGGSSAPARKDLPPLLDPLSDAELRVVRYLPSNLKAPEIAAELFVSTNTIRTHLRHIYAKLGAHGRADAVAHARQYGLLSPSSRHR